MFRTISLLIVLLTGGCAYYNTFYNAQKNYEEALEYAREHPDDPASHEKELLDAAVVGAGRVLARYPDSRWVDDAQLLLGNALLLRGHRTLVGSGRSDFEEAMRSYASSMVMTESEDILDRARLGMGRAAMALERYNDAAAAFMQVSSKNERRHAISRLLLCEAYIMAGQPGLAAAVHDTLTPGGGDSLEAEYYITGGRILTELGMPDSGAVVALRASEIQDRGDVYYRSLVAAAESFIEAGMPDMASQELNRLLMGYRSDREMADISLLKGRADELAGDTTAALASYLNAAQLDSYRETGAEALYRRSLLLERARRYDEALQALENCSSRPGDFLWLRLAGNRARNLSLYRMYADSAGHTSGETSMKLRLLAAEKRLELYGADEETIEDLRDISGLGHVLFSPMAAVLLAENTEIQTDSMEQVLLEIVEEIPTSDLAGRIEEQLGIPTPEGIASRRPSAILERAWVRIDEENWTAAWEILDELLDSPFSYEVRAEALWAAYLASEGARMSGSLVDSYLRELVDVYPMTPQGMEAAVRRAQGLESEGEEE